MIFRSCQSVSRTINWFKSLDVAKDLSDAKWPILLLLTMRGGKGDGTGSPSPLRVITTIMIIIAMLSILRKENLHCVLHDD